MPVAANAGEPVVLQDPKSAAARALDYQPNLTASSLRRSDGKTRTIGLLLENVANPYESALHRRIDPYVLDLAKPGCADRIADLESPEGWRFADLEAQFDAQRFSNNAAAFEAVKTYILERVAQRKG